MTDAQPTADRPSLEPTQAFEDAFCAPQARSGFMARGWLRLKNRLQARWPVIRRTLPRDLVILLWLGLLAQAFSVAWVMTDSVHTSLAIVVRHAPVQPGQLAVFAYRGQSIPGYRDPDSWTMRLGRALGSEPSTHGPSKGDGFVKYLWGVPGDRIEVAGRRVFLTTSRGRFDMGVAKPASQRGAPLTPVQPGVIPPGYVYMWAPHEDALDSRYSVMGLVPIDSIVGKAVALW